MFRISEKIWERIKILIPSKKSKIGRPRKDSKTILDGIFFVMHTGIQWGLLPSYYGAVSTVHGTFMRWVKEGIFQKILKMSIELSIEILGKPQSFHYDTSSQKAPFARFSGYNPTDRKKQGVKKGVVIDFKKIILSLSFDPANVHDSKTLESHLENIKQFTEEKPLVLSADSAFDDTKLRKKCADYNLALNASTNVRRDKNKQKLKVGGQWKSEQVFGILHWNRGIKFCWLKLKESALAFLQFAAAVHNFRLVGVFG